jgi:hypothetical protein
MPRKGKGQAVRTASGQEYGEAKAQQEAQEVVALPRNVMRPGEMKFNRPSELPNQSIMATAPNPQMTTPKDEFRQQKVAAMLPVMEALASMPNSDPAMRNMLRVLRGMVNEDQ